VLNKLELDSRRKWRKSKIKRRVNKRKLKKRNNERND
jgi:hypothetical protein